MNILERNSPALLSSTLIILTPLPRSSFRTPQSHPSLHQLGWKHSIELQEGIKLMYEYYLQNKSFL